MVYCSTLVPDAHDIVTPHCDATLWRHIVTPHCDATFSNAMTPHSLTPHSPGATFLDATFRSGAQSLLTPHSLSCRPFILKPPLFRLESPLFVWLGCRVSFVFHAPVCFHASSFVSSHPFSFQHPSFVSVRKVRSIFRERAQKMWNLFPDHSVRSLAPAVTCGFLQPLEWLQVTVLSQIKKLSCVSCVLNGMAG